jgi:hypothetical protein
MLDRPRQGEVVFQTIDLESRLCFSESGVNLFSDFSGDGAGNEPAYDEFQCKVNYSFLRGKQGSAGSKRRSPT